MKNLPQRPTRLSQLRSEWGLSRQAAWDRLRRARARDLVVRQRRGVYAPKNTSQPDLPDRAQDLVRALSGVRAYRWAITGLDLLLGELHYLPAHYPHLLLVEPAGEEALRRALGAAGFLAVSTKSVADIWKSNPTQPVVVVRPAANFRGVALGETASSLPRAFLDVLVEVRRGFPFPGRDLQRIWQQFPADTRDAILRLGKQLHRRPFYTAGSAEEVRDLEVDVT